MPEPRTRIVNGRPVRLEDGAVLASRLLELGWTRFHDSRSGAPRGPLCGMGTCHECRVTLDGVEHVRSCLVAGGGPGGGEGAVPDGGGATALREEACDVAVPGGGPAGMAAAAAAAGAGRSVVLLDENPALGGQIWRSPGCAAGTAPRAAAAAAARVRSAGVRVLAATTVIDARRTDAGFELDALGPSSPVRVRARRLVLATGAREVFLPFPGWTLPGVFGAGGLQALVKGGFDVAGKRILVAGSGPLLLAVAAFLRRKGARVLGVVEQAPGFSVRGFARGLWRHPGKALQALALKTRLAGIPHLAGSWPLRVEGAGRVERVVISAGGRERTFACDALAAGFGLVPNAGVAALLGCRIEGGAIVAGADLGTTVAGVYAAGEALGIGGVACALIEGRMAGLAAAGDVAGARSLARRRVRERAFAARLARAFRLRSELRLLVREDTPVCRCEDVAFGRLVGCASWREAKLRTRCGMGPCQGRVCGPALEFLNGWPALDARPPLAPAPVGVLAELARAPRAGVSSGTGERTA